METAHRLVVFAFIWLVVVPPAIAQVASDIAEERIFENILAWIDRKYRGTMLAYLVRCPVCLSHWLSGVTALLFWEGWSLLPFGGSLRVMTALAGAGAVTRIARFWLK